MPFDGPDHQIARARAGRVRQPSQRRGLRARRPRLRGQLRAAPGRGAGPGRRSGAAGATAGGEPVRPRVLNIQEQGGITRTVEAAVEAVHRAPARGQRLDADRAAGLEDRAWRWSAAARTATRGVTANPALGVAADLLVAQGGTAVLGETTEIYGAEHLLTRRAVTPGGRREAGRADQVVGVVHRHLRRRDQQQPVAGQQGRRPDDDLREVARGARQGRLDRRWSTSSATPSRSTTPGLVFMDTPGYDPPCMTGLVAGGANVLVFTTGRGSVLGLQADAVHQGGDQHADVRADDRRHGHRTPARSSRASRSRASAGGSSR